MALNSIWREEAIRELQNRREYYYCESVDTFIELGEVNDKYC
jgi:hypothetical protein